MDRFMQMRIGYYCGWLDPEMVAVSKEVFQLLNHFPGSFAFGVCDRYLVTLSLARRSFGVHTRFYALFRQAMRFLERRFDVSHVYTGLQDWHFLNALGRRPIVLTMTQRGDSPAPELLRKVAHVVAETEPLAAAAVRAGIPEERVSLIYPGVDLAQYQPAPPPPQPWKGLFASSPENEEEIYTKGVDLLLDLATLEPGLELTLLWRPFGSASDRALARVVERGLANVRVVRGRIPDMHRFYEQFHFTVAPFRSVGKPCPNSILESLAAGRPVLVSDYVDIGGLVEREGAGLSFARTAEELRRAFHRMCMHYASLQPGARRCAERWFDLRHTLRAYEDVYERVANGRSHPCFVKPDVLSARGRNNDLSGRRNTQDLMGSASGFAGAREGQH
jgi:glycosyltransferase involved in cell wall biosynthesis